MQADHMGHDSKKHASDNRHQNSTVEKTEDSGHIFIGKRLSNKEINDLPYPIGFQHSRKEENEQKLDDLVEILEETEGSLENRKYSPGDQEKSTRVASETEEKSIEGSYSSRSCNPSPSSPVSEFAQLPLVIVEDADNHTSPEAAYVPYTSC